MILSETDALTRWCPMTRIGGQNERGNRVPEREQYNCLASDCMLWTWFDVGKTLGFCGLTNIYIANVTGTGTPTGTGL